MKSFLERLRFWFETATYKRTLTILGVLTILAAIPLTVYLSGQNQDIRQRADEIDCNNREATCQSIANSVLGNLQTQANSEYTTCMNTCDSTNLANSCPADCESEKSSKLTQATDNYAAGIQACSVTKQACIAGIINCVGQSDDRIEYQCQTFSNDTCMGGWTRSTNGSCSSTGGLCCYRQNSPIVTATPTPVGEDGGPPGGGADPTAIPTSSNQQCSTPLTCIYSESATSCFTGSGAVGFNQPGCQYIPNCSGATTCPIATVTPPTSGTSATPVGGGSGGGILPTTTPAPTVAVNPAVTCNTNDISLTTNGGQQTTGQPISFYVNGDASTWIDDNYQGAVTNCTGAWNSRTCTTTNSGQFTWTHKWQRCVGSVTNCSPQCSKSTTFTILVGSPTAGPTASPLSAPGGTSLACQSGGTLRTNWNSVSGAGGYFLRVNNVHPTSFDPNEPLNGYDPSNPALNGKDLSIFVPNGSTTSTNIAVDSGLRYNINIQTVLPSENYPFRSGRTDMGNTTCNGSTGASPTAGANNGTQTWGCGVGTPFVTDPDSVNCRATYATGGKFFSCDIEPAGQPRSTSGCTGNQSKGVAYTCQADGKWEMWVNGQAPEIRCLSECYTPEISCQSTSSPTTGPTRAPDGGATLALQLNLAGILSGRNDLIRPTRSVLLDIIKPDGTRLTTALAQVPYDTTSGLFKGSVFVQPIAGGNYTLKIKSDGYLFKRIPNFITIPDTSSGNQSVTVPIATLITGDLNNDNVVNILDYNLFKSCFDIHANTSACGANKPRADLDDNGIVDIVDFNIWVSNLSTQSGD